MDIPFNGINIQMLLYNRFENLDLFGPFDVFALAEKLQAPLHASLVTLDGASEVVSFQGVSVKPTGSYDPSADIFFIPGCALIWDSVQIEGLAEALPHWQQPGKTLVADCTGTLLAAKTGILKGRNANTLHLAADALGRYGVNVIHARVVDDGNLITSGGITSGIDLAIWIIERFLGNALALQIEQIMEYERRGVVWRSQ